MAVIVLFSSSFFSFGSLTGGRAPPFFPLPSQLTADDPSNAYTACSLFLLPFLFFFGYWPWPPFPPSPPAHSSREAQSVLPSAI